VVELCDRFREKGIRIFVWTLNDPEIFQRIKAHIDGIITDEVELFSKMR